MEMDVFSVIVISLFLVLPFIYECFPSFRYNFKFSFCYVYVTIISILLIPVFMLRPRETRNIRICHYLIGLPLSRLLGIRWELQGMEHMKQDQGCIIVANHQTSLDILGMFFMWLHLDRCITIGKKVILLSPFGVAAWLGGQVFISRSSKAHITINQVGQIAREKKLKVFMFPEGTRSTSDTLLPFKKGAFVMAINAQIPILPVVYSSYTFMDSEKKIFNTGKMIVRTLPAISTKGMGKDNVEELIECVRNMMQKTYTSISADARDG